MDDGEFTPNSEFSGAFSGPAMDLDFMDELLFDGCWLETADKLNLSQQPGPSTSGGQNDSVRQYLPFVEFNNSHLTVNHPQQTYQELIGKNSSGNAPLNSPKLEELVNTSQNQNLLQFGSLPNGVNEISRSLWIEPRDYSAAASSVTDRLLNAIRHLKDSTKDRDVLMQIWVPIKKGGKQVLSTTGQPFFLNPNYKSLASYRSISERYYFRAEADSKDLAGLPGRVFLRQLPEWTPDVRFFRTDEYPRKNHAKQCNISGSLAVPVLERGSRTCLGVVEVVTTTQDIDCHPDLQNICQALEACDLTGSKDFCPPSVKACKEFCQALVPELSEILGSVCSAHGLPLALTWAPCFRQGKGGCRHFNEKYARSISTVDSACFVADKDLLRFHAACSKQYLFLGQGIVGRAFLTNKQCFASNITAFSQTDYPFAHHAKMFGLRAAVAIPLRTADAGSPDFVLELFLPKGCQGTEEQKRVWESLSVAIQQACRSLQVVMDKEIQEDVSSQIVGDADGRHNREETQKFVSSLSKDPSPKESSWFSQMMETQRKGKAIQVSWDCPKEEPKGEFQITTQWDNTYHDAVLPEFGQVQKNSQLKGSVESAKYSSFSGNHSSGNRKPGEKRRTKTEKTISLDVLRQYFAGSLKDAAKSIGVCPTTLKRICRQHGITRWPSRKLKKVGHSLKKLQLVIDSVQGAEGAIQIESFYTAFPELTSPKISGSGPLLSFKTGDDSKQPIPQPESGGTGSKSLSSSSSQSSASSQCCSTEVRQNTTINNDVSGNGDAQMVDDPGSVLKRTRSDAELHALIHEEPKLLVRSQSHKTFGEHPNLETLPPLPKSSGRVLPEQGVFKVKATFGDDKIRFSLPPNWSFRDLQQEIAKRFKIEDVSIIDLKYLDDDNEWVLLTCDPDLEECKEVYRLSQGHTIKISLHQASQAHLGSL